MRKNESGGSDDEDGGADTGAQSAYLRAEDSLARGAMAFHEQWGRDIVLLFAMFVTVFFLYTVAIGEPMTLVELFVDQFELIGRFFGER